MPYYAVGKLLSKLFIHYCFNLNITKHVIISSYGDALITFSFQSFPVTALSQLYVATTIVQRRVLVGNAVRDTEFVLL